MKTMWDDQSTSEESIKSFKKLHRGYEDAAFWCDEVGKKIEELLKSIVDSQLLMAKLEEYEEHHIKRIFYSCNSFIPYRNGPSLWYLGYKRDNFQWTENGVGLIIYLSRHNGISVKIMENNTKVKFEDLEYLWYEKFEINVLNSETKRGQLIFAIHFLDNFEKLREIINIFSEKEGWLDFEFHKKTIDDYRI